MHQSQPVKSHEGFNLEWSRSEATKRKRTFSFPVPFLPPLPPFHKIASRKFLSFLLLWSIVLANPVTRGVRRAVAEVKKMEVKNES